MFIIIEIIRYTFEFQFIIEIILLTLLFTKEFPKRTHFSKRILGLFFILIISVCFFIKYNGNELNNTIPFTIARFVIFFFIVVAGIMFCFKQSALASIFCVTGAYAIQHLVYNINEMILIGFNVKGLINQNDHLYLLYVFIYILVVGNFYSLMYHFYIKRFKTEKSEYFENKFLIILCVFVNLYATVFSIIFRITQENAQITIFFICIFLAIMCCLFTLYLLFYMFRTSVLNDELNVIQSLLNKEKKQFLISQNNIELMNLKFHDLKYQLTHLSNQIDKENIEELKKIISIYDIPRTGNPVLDVVITEKKLYCEQENIDMTYMVDGEKLKFMSESDIYSLFGNAIDNAINSVKALKDEDKRFISLIVKENMGLVSIHIENYFQSEIVFSEGLPVTTKNNADFHGFGIKSMKYITEKYGGELNIKIEDDVFNLNILF